jgi:hypothetical protein
MTVKLSEGTLDVPGDRQLKLRPVRVEDGEDLFAEGTATVYAFLRDELGDAAVVLDTQPERYAELAQHSVMVSLGVLAVKWVVVPTAVGVLANYLYHKYGSPEKVEVRLVVQTERCTLHYDGSGSEMAAALEGARAVVEAGKVDVGNELLDITHLLEPLDEDDG